jgi:2-keto-4-pentenoate hydratase/2-oxohepta-3-ene-1,7-dioic acid hydratase in catechol pathway
MKIVRCLVRRKAEYGIVEGDTIILCDGDPFTKLKKRADKVALKTAKLLAPVSPPNVICIGLNYKKHADEICMARPSKPVVFMKPTTTVCGPYDDVVLPAADNDQIDFEGELTVVIKKSAKFIAEKDVSKYILGYTVANDISNRGVQFTDGQWVRSKSYDTFCPIGPAIVTGINGDDLDIRTCLDGKVMQSSNTSDMIFTINKIVSFLSQGMTLLPGTIILTGTPEGVGVSRKPQVFLKAGQMLETEIEGIGKLTNRIVRSQAKG